MYSKTNTDYPVLKLDASRFDYSSISSSIVSDLQAQANLIRRMVARTTAALIEIGNHLRAVKDNHLVEYGQFIDWVESEVGISRRTAQSYMAIARLAEAKSATVALLPPTTAHRLAANSAPAEVVDYVINRAAAGETLPYGNVVAMMKEAKWKRLQDEKREQANFRRSKAGRSEEERKKEKADWQRREREEEERQRREKAEATAQALIEEFGIATIKRIADALNDYYVGYAIDKIAKKDCCSSKDVATL